MCLLICFVVWAQDTTSGTSSAGGLDVDLESIHRKLVEAVGPLCVRIKVERQDEGEKKKNPFDVPMITGGPFADRPSGPVSGTIVDASGLILTTYFNVEGKVKKISVTLPDGTEKPATVVGYDAPLDVALLRVEALKLPVPSFANLRKYSVGQFVYGFGRSPNGSGCTINQGVISAFDRFAGTAWQIDSRANYGNAGGPVVDREGKLIGILGKVHTRYAATYGQNSGVSFAITWDKIAEVIPKMKEGVRVEVNRRPFLGVSFDATAPTKGAAVQDVIENTAAQRAGIKKGDVIVEFAGKIVESGSDLRAEILKRRPGEVVKIKVQRDGHNVELEATLGEQVVED